MIDFTDQVAIVTGAGRGLGRHYALDLARRGAKVVVNDLGCSVDGNGADPSVADEVVEEIRSTGGTAVASYDSVGTPEDGAAIVKTALDHFGRLDAVVSNAGIVEMMPFEDIPAENWSRMINTHLDGSFYVSQPAYKVMKEQGYGRLVFIASSAGAFGMPYGTHYAAAKAGILGLTNNIALEGRPHGILANAVLPFGLTRMAFEAEEGSLLRSAPQRSSCRLWCTWRAASAESHIRTIRHWRDDMPGSSSARPRDGCPMQDARPPLMTYSRISTTSVRPSRSPSRARSSMRWRLSPELSVLDRRLSPSRVEATPLWRASVHGVGPAFFAATSSPKYKKFDASSPLTPLGNEKRVPPRCDRVAPQPGVLGQSGRGCGELEHRMAGCFSELHAPDALTRNRLSGRDPEGWRWRFEERLARAASFARPAVRGTRASAGSHGRAHRHRSDRLCSFQHSRACELSSDGSSAPSVRPLPLSPRFLASRLRPAIAHSRRSRRPRSLI